MDNPFLAADFWVGQARQLAEAGFGATPPAESRPDLEVPDLQTLAVRMGLL